MSERVDIDDRSPHLLSTTKLLRLVSLIWVGLGFGAIQYFAVGQVGDSMEWKDGKVAISAGSHPALLVWSAVAMALFGILMVRNPSPVIEGVPTTKRRIVAFLIDFWFSLSILSAVGAVVPLLLEAGRTGHFEWHFQRNYSANTDGFAALWSLLSMAMLIIYFAFPLTRGRQTVGCFIMRVKVAPPFGKDGRFTFRAAIVRTFYAFVGLCSIATRKLDRDEQGRTWYDRTTNCTVVMVSDD